MRLPTVADIRSKVDRANENIEEFEFRAGLFYKTNPYVIRFHDDAHSGQRHWYVESIKEIPGSLAGATADALGNLRKPLDYIAARIEYTACGGKPKKRRVYFPVGRDATTYKANLSRNIQCARKAAIDAFNAAEPYKGGRGEALWQLHELARPDRHELPLATAARYSSFDAAPLMKDLFRKHADEVARDGFDVQQMLDITASVFINPSHRKCPLEVGDHIFREPIDPEMKEDRKFLFDVSFNEPGVIECEPVLPTLKNMADLVSSTITAFEPLL